MTIRITSLELCQRNQLTTETLVEIVEHGIVEPEGSGPEDWRFDLNYVCTVRRAARLHRDLGIDWNGIALVLDLLDERERLRRENQMLAQRLGRFEL